MFLGVAAVGLVAYRVALGESIAPTRRLRDLGVTGALLLLPAVLGAWPYLRVQEDVGLRRWLVNWAVPASSFLASPAHVQTFLLSFVPSWRIIETAKANLFPGFVPLLLAAVAVGWRLGGRRAAAPPGVWWARAALLLEIATLAGLAVGLYVTTFGPVRWKVMGSLLIKVGNTRRAWTAVVIAAGLRAALSRRVPLVVRSRLRCALEAARAWARAHRRDTTTFYLLLTAAAVWLSVGPPIGIWPLVYWLPGFNFIRVPSRFTILAVLGLAVLAGKGFEHLSARLAPRRRVVVTVAVSVLLLGEFAAMPLPTVPYRVETPEVARWLAHQPKPFVVAEVPVTTYERLQSTYMLHSMAHWQKTVNGYSGFRPALHKKLNAELRRFPNRESLERLAGLGVDYVVVHPNLYPPEQWPEVEARLQQFADWLTLAHTGADGRVYTLRRPPDGRP